jgi:hypothetical protein
VPNSAGLASRVTSRARGAAGSIPPVKRALGRVGQHLPRPLQQDPQLGLGAGRSHMCHNLPPAAVVLGDLHGRRP